MYGEARRRRWHRLVTVITAGIALWTLQADARSQPTIIYFVRHSENEVRLIRTNTGGNLPATFVEECTPTRSCCIQPLSALGQARRDALAEWFVDHGLARSLTHLIATNKPRTVETLRPLAIVSGLGSDRDGNGTLDGSDVDLVPGDGIQQYPSDALECAPAYQRTLDSKPLIVDAIRALPPGSRAVVANHSDTLYAIITEATGVDTSDPVLFPKEAGSTTRVRNFNDLWIVEIGPTGAGMLLKHVVFDIALERQRRQ
jgi:broad specificity phosphatase PhoE